MPNSSPNAPTTTARAPFVAVAGVGLLAAVAWVFLGDFVNMWGKWGRDPRYSHGYLVPLFSVFLLWSRRRYLETHSHQSYALGLVMILLGLGLRAGGVYIYNDWFAGLALIPLLLGVAMLAFGRAGFHWAWPAALFLIFMVPLPYRFEVALTQPLQGIATQASTYLLQTFGFVALAEGNTIRMSEGVRLGVVEACSGLSMMMIFLAMATAMVIVMQQPWYEKVILIGSTIPIAVIANITRITSTGVMYKTVGREFADKVFHDFAGWLMMPLALAMLGLVMATVSRLIVDNKDPDLAILFGKTRQAAKA